MARCTLLLFVLAVAGAPQLVAQKPPPTGAQAQPQPRTAPATGKASGKVFHPASAAPTSAPASSAAPHPSQVTPQAARPDGAGPAYTAGLALQPYSGTTSDAALDYAARFGRLLDSAVVSLVEVFRNTSGQPMEGADNPADLSQRERDRWARCRNVYWDLTTFASAVGTLRRVLPSNLALQQAVAGLDSAFAASQATAECDNVASMIAAPDRWAPWHDRYQNAAQHFYQDFYAQLREVHERDRAFVNALNAVLPPGRGRIAVPAGLPRNPPYAGMAPGD